MPIVGDVLAGRYRIDAPIGAGGMASVYRADDLRLEREVAVKVLLPNLAADPNLAERFGREALALASTSHPSVVKVFDVEPGDPATGREPFYVMELCAGGSLADRLAVRGSLEPDELVAAIAAVAAGLADLHQRGFVHRDVKPHDILFDEGRALLADFGLTRSEPRRLADRSYRSEGTPARGIAVERRVRPDRTGAPETARIPDGGLGRGHPYRDLKHESRRRRWATQGIGGDVGFVMPNEAVRAHLEARSARSAHARPGPALAGGTRPPPRGGLRGIVGRPGSLLGAGKRIGIDPGEAGISRQPPGSEEMAPGHRSRALRRSRLAPGCRQGARRRADPRSAAAALHRRV